VGRKTVNKQSINRTRTGIPHTFILTLSFILNEFGLADLVFVGGFFFIGALLFCISSSSSFFFEPWEYCLE
jgi:hypothetical protein